MPFPNPDTQFKKGQSGNPDGYPKGVPNRSTTLRKWKAVIEKAKNPLTGEIEELDQEDQAILNLLMKAKSPEDPQAITAIREMLDTLYGKNADVLQADVTSTIAIVDADTTE